MVVSNLLNTNISFSHFSVVMNISALHHMALSLIPILEDLCHATFLQLFPLFLCGKKKNIQFLDNACAPSNSKLSWRLVHVHCDKATDWLNMTWLLTSTETNLAF